MSYIAIDLKPSDGWHPDCQNRKIQDGSALFRLFHQYKPHKLVRTYCSRVIPEVLVDIGRLKAVIYSSDRGQSGMPRTYIHFMQVPPTLACDVTGRQLYIVGGQYRIGRRGIEG